MRILDRYILKSIFVVFAGTVFTFAFLFVLIDMFSHLQDFIEKSVSVGVIAQYYLPSCRRSLYKLPPWHASLLSCYLQQPQRHNEITAIRASGMNFWQITRPALVFALFVAPWYSW